MQCDQFEQILEQQDDGPLPKPALAHMDVCEACRALMADLGEIHEVAMELGAEGIVPPERIWVALRNQLEAEGIIHDPQAAPLSISHGWWTVFQRPALAGAFLALILVAATAITFRQDSSQMAMHPQLALQQDISVPFGGKRIQGRSTDRWERFDSGLPEAGRRGDRFHPSKPRNC